MGQSAKALIALVGVVATCLGIGAWIFGDHPKQITWIVRFAAPALAVAICILLWLIERRKDLAPDYLRAEFGTCFERDGLCFMPAIRVTNGMAMVNIFYQNRYARLCTCNIFIAPQPGFFTFQRADVPTIHEEVVADGGAVGVLQIPYPIKTKYQGKKLKYEVAATTNYPNGTGKLLRFREGMWVGTYSSTVARTAKTLSLGAAGVISIRRPATWTTVIPTNVSELVPTDAATTSKVLWWPDVPTGGFPVITKAGGSATPPPDATSSSLPACRE